MKRQVANDAVQDMQPSNVARWDSDYFKLREFENGRSREITFSLSPSLLCAGALFSLRLWVDMSSSFKDGFSCYYLNNIEL